MKKPHDCEETLKAALEYLDQAFVQMPAVVREGSWGRRLQAFLDAALED